jgi:DNA-binding LacI/PurR family transcriptional regulator
MIRSGRRRIAMVTGPAWLPCTQVPVDAYRDAVRAAGLPARTVTGDFSADAGRAGAIEVLRRWPDTDALYAVCDATALGALAALRRLGRRVPDDVAVAGFDDIPVARHLAPALTTASHPVELIAAAATATVLGRDEPAEEVVFASELVARESA